MCFMCEAQFDAMSKYFNDTFTEYLACHQRGETRDTPAKRVHDLAFDYQEMCAEDRDMTILLSWYLAITLERLAALETSGIPT